MKKEMKSFFLRMAVVLLVLGAVCFVGAYGAGKTLRGNAADACLCGTGLCRVSG